MKTGFQKGGVWDKEIWLFFLILWESLVTPGNHINVEKTLKNAFVLIILFIPFISTISSRFEKGGTDNDIQLLLEGKYDDRYETEGNATMTYRLAWLYERTSYLIERPIGEQIFGMGLISDSQPIVQKIYNFRLGLEDQTTGFLSQLSTADISYGNLICKLGFVGTFIYLYMIISIAIFFYRRKELNPIFSICAATLMMLFVLGISGGGLSNINNFVYLFIFIALYKSHNKRIIYESNTH